MVKSQASMRCLAGRVSGKAPTARSRCLSVKVAAGASLDMIKMSPLGDRVLIKPKAKEEKSAGGLILAGSSSESLDAALTGTIVAVGDEVEIDVAAGDQVLYTKYGSSDIETDEGNVSFVVEKSILAKLT